MYTAFELMGEAFSVNPTWTRLSGPMFTLAISTSFRYFRAIKTDENDYRMGPGLHPVPYAPGEE